MFASPEAVAWGASTALTQLLTVATVCNKAKYDDAASAGARPPSAGACALRACGAACCRPPASGAGAYMARGVRAPSLGAGATAVAVPTLRDAEDRKMLGDATDCGEQARARAQQHSRHQRNCLGRGQQLCSSAGDSNLTPCHPHLRVQACCATATRASRPTCCAARTRSCAPPRERAPACCRALHSIGCREPGPSRRQRCANSSPPPRPRA